MAESDYKVMNELSRQVEQSEAGVENMAALTAIYWKRLHLEGLTRNEATQLTAAWINALMGGNNSKGKAAG